MFWGSYRPGNYFGMKTRDAHSLVMGLMWYFPRQLLGGGKGIRHWCDSGDNLAKYGWTKHDGRTFGIQEIYDGAFKLETSFIKTGEGKNGGEWSARVAVTNTSSAMEDISLIWYTALDDKTNGWIQAVDAEVTGVGGETVGLGKFLLSFHTNGKIIKQSYVSTVGPGLHALKETIQNYVRLVPRTTGSTEKTLALVGEALVDPQGNKLEPNFIATQVTVRAPFTLDITYRSINGDPLEGLLDQKPDDFDVLVEDNYTKKLQEKSDEFSAKFEEKFRLKGKGYSESNVTFAESALSNLVGGIGYFYGSSRVQSGFTREPVPYWKAPLYTAVPSRSFFPRGFLWDEGFHGLLIGMWDLDIELDIINHWFDLMNVEGWIPREQILGVEALAKVPEEFVTQRNTNANPPTFFLTLKMLLNRYKTDMIVSKNRLANLQRLYPRLQAWFSWFNTTQKGEVPGSYRWRGRDELTVRELNPKTLTSGLDDFPRASHPNKDERHLDLRCWIALAAGVMADLAKILDRSAEKYEETHQYLTDPDLLDRLHLSGVTQTYADYGLHTDNVVLKKPISNPTSPKHQQQQNVDMIRFVNKPPVFRLVDTSFGYVNLFPFLMQYLSPQSSALLKILSNIRDTEVLWTPFGIRSLSKKSPYYMKRNTEHDPPYWRGQIWININYLTLKSLHHYKNLPGPYAAQAKEIYTELRDNVVNNIIKQYTQTGYIWEQYNDRTGEGSGCKPFTGWSSLVVLIMSEQY